MRAEGGLSVNWSLVEREARPHARAAVVVAFVGMGLGLVAHFISSAAWGHHIISAGHPAIAEIVSVSQKPTLLATTYRIDYRFRDGDGRLRMGSCITTRLPVPLGDNRVVVFYDDYGTSVAAGTEPPLLPPWILPILVMPVSFVLVVAARERLRRTVSVLRRGERLRAEIVGMKRLWWRMVWVEPPVRVRLRFRAGRGVRYVGVVTYLWRRLKGMHEVTLIRRGRVATIYELYAGSSDATA